MPSIRHQKDILKIVHDKKCEGKGSKSFSSLGSIDFWMAIVVVVLQIVGLEEFIENLTKLVSRMAQSAPTDGIGIILMFTLSNRAGTHS